MMIYWVYKRESGMKISDNIMYSRNLSAPAFAADFPPDAPKFNQRTLHVRLINLCTSDKKSSHKIRHSKIPRVHYIYFISPVSLRSPLVTVHSNQQNP